MQLRLLNKTKPTTALLLLLSDLFISNLDFSVITPYYLSFQFLSRIIPH